MKTTALIIPIALASTTHAGITNLEDHRYAYATTSLFGGPSFPLIEESIEYFYSDPNQSLDEYLSLSASDQTVGNAASSALFESNISTTMFSSSASISSQAITLDGGVSVWTNAGFLNSINFTLDETTIFSIDGFISGSGQTAGTYLNFGQVDEEGNPLETMLDLSAINLHQDIHTTLTLEAGEYLFRTLSFTFAYEIDVNQSNSTASAHDITVTVIPTPASYALIFLGSILTTRRRR